MADNTADHNHRFIEHYRLDTDNFEWVDYLREAKGSVIPLPEQFREEHLWVNDPIVFNGNTLARVKLTNEGTLGAALVPTRKINICGLEPRGFEQYFAADLLMDESIQCLTLWGIAGSGKTTWALAAAIEQIRRGKYQNGIHLMKPVSYVGRSVGLLPGEIDAKIAPFAASMTQHLEGLMGQQSSIGNKIHCQAIEYQRGMNYTDALVIIDEGQNLDEHVMFTLLTRIGQGAKIIVCGDLTQIDEGGIKKKQASGLSMLLNNFRRSDDSDIASVQFFKSERRGISLKAVERLSDLAQ